MAFPYTLDTLLETVEYTRIRGENARKIEKIAALDQAGASDLSFLSSSKYSKALLQSKAGFVFVPQNYSEAPNPDQVFIEVKSPSMALAQFCELVKRESVPSKSPGVHPTAVVHAGATVASCASVGPFCVIEDAAVIGEGAVLESHVYVGYGVSIGHHSTLRSRVVVESHCKIGGNCLLHPGVVIGADGFGFESSAAGHYKIPQVGTVRIEDQVEIGANSCVDRARFAETVIGQGTKIDNQVQIGHNVKIGKYCLICAHVGIAGSTEVGDFVVMAGQAGIGGHIKIASQCQIGGQAGVAKSISEKSYVTGTPARPFNQQRRLEALIHQLPTMNQRLKALEKNQLSSSDKSTP